MSMFCFGMKEYTQVGGQIQWVQRKAILFTREDSKKMGTQGMGNRDTSRQSSGLVKIMFSSNGYRRLPECFEIKSFENIDNFRLTGNLTLQLTQSVTDVTKAYHKTQSISLPSVMPLLI